MPRPALDEHRAKVGMICEMLSKKYDRFGWDRMEPAIRSEIRRDFMDALQDFPIDEIRQATRECEADQPGKMPTEHHIKARIIASRQRVREFATRNEPAAPTPQPVTREAAAEIMERAGFTPKRFAQVRRNPQARTAAEFTDTTGQELDRHRYMTPAEIEAEDRRREG